MTARDDLFNACLKGDREFEPLVAAFAAEERAAGLYEAADDAHLFVARSAARPVAEWLRVRAAALASAGQVPTTAEERRLTALRRLIHAEGGEWTTHRVHTALTPDLPITRAQCRALLKSLEAEGLVARVERPGRRYWVLTGHTGADR